MVIKYFIVCVGLVAKATLNNNIHSVISMELDIHFPLAFLLKMYSWINLKKKTWQEGKKSCIVQVRHYIAATTTVH